MSGKIEPGVPFEVYQKWDGISITRLSELKRSPQHYRYRLANPRSTQPMTLGTAAHCAVLEPKRFAEEYAIWSRMTESGSQAPRRGQYWDAFVDENPGKRILTVAEYTSATDLAKAIRRDPVAMKYLDQGDPEVSMQWNFRNKVCKGRPDWITHIDGKPVIVGLKTTRDCRPFKFGNDAARMMFHCQWAFYQDGYDTITDTGLPRMVEIVVESAPPHAVVVYNIDGDVLDQGREDYNNLIDQLEYCEKNDAWDGPGQGVEQSLSLPSWVYTHSGEGLEDLDLETE